MIKDQWTEYRYIESAAEAHEGDAKASMGSIDLEYMNHAMIAVACAQAEATLAVAARLEALAYAVRHMPRSTGRATPRGVWRAW